MATFTCVMLFTGFHLRCLQVCLHSTYQTNKQTNRDGIDCTMTVPTRVLIRVMVGTPFSHPIPRATILTDAFLRGGEVT